MSELTSFSRFPRFPLEIRLMIWECTLHPRVFPLVFERLQRTEEPSASPGSVQDSSSPEATPSRYPDIVLTVRCFSTPDILRPGALYASRESRDLVFQRGYRVWKMQDGQGRTRDVVWNPDVDVILFPPVSRIHDKRLLTYFSSRYPEETRMARKLAFYTSIGFKDYPWGKQWLLMAELAELAGFGATTELVVVVDEDVERAEVEGLMKSNRSQDSWNPLKIPADIEEWFEKGKLHWPFISRAPVVRVVESSERILSSQSLQVCLRCNPCEYLGMV